MAVFSLPDDAATDAFGAALAPFLHAGDVILLSGPVGAGKSTLSRAIIRTRLAELDRVEDIPSPTFTLVQTYDLDDLDIWHVDLYRLTEPAELDELGLIDAFDDQICLVEWAERLGGLAPATALCVEISVTEDDRRNLSLEWEGERWNSVVQTMIKNGARHWQIKTK
ncbi:MAG: tRNA (adenosine(37)-N6)-threonylcarbamoyltransferase complex ATPase subunit type 1 TsaE [Pseudomonadota bacterium]